MSSTDSVDKIIESEQCPTCHETFASPRGMRVHHTTVHGEHLPNRRCRTCNDPFFAPNGDRTRCENCTTQQQTTPRDPTRGNATGRCLVCESTFQYYPSEKSGLYCPKCVADPDTKCTVHETSTQVTIACTTCGAKKELYPSEVAERTDHFCSRTCYREWLSATQRADEKWTGPDNPNWNGGVDQDGLYGEGWPTARRQALARDDYRCQRCGTGKDNLGRNPDVHHIEPVRTFIDPRDAHVPSNLVSLCRPCHIAVERGEATLSGD